MRLFVFVFVHTCCVRAFKCMFPMCVRVRALRACLHMLMCVWRSCMCACVCARSYVCVCAFVFSVRIHVCACVCTCVLCMCVCVFTSVIVSQVLMAAFRIFREVTTIALHCAAPARPIKSRVRILERWLQQLDEHMAVLRDWANDTSSEHGKVGARRTETRIMMSWYNVSQNRCASMSACSPMLPSCARPRKIVPGLFEARGPAWCQRDLFEVILMLLTPLAEVTP